MRLTCYPEYKNSGLEWLGSVPAHWQIKRGKTLFSCIDLRSETGEEELLTVSSVHGVIPRKSASVTMFKAESYVGYKLCWPGDLVINSLWAWACGLGVSRHYGIISTAYGVYRPHANKVDYSFIHELVRSTPFHWELRVRSKGVWTSRLQLTDWAFLDAPFPVPPLPEQMAIVRYLNYMDRRIRRYIRDKQKLIKLLEEQKQAIIHKAVTRGLDPNIRLKPSGIEWLGYIPAHWNIRRLRYLIRGRLTYGANIAAEHENRDWPRYLRITDFQKDGTLRPDTFRSLPPEIAKDFLVQPGDILFARSGATVGKAFLVEAEDGKACHAGYLIRARPITKLIVPKFMFAFTQSAGFREWKDCTFNTATIQNIGADKYANLYIPLPPVAEQTIILEYLKMQAAPIDAIIHRTEQEMRMIREYRTSLIADVVTGKLDVREAATHLPDEAVEPENIDTVDELAEADNDTESMGLDHEPVEAEE